MRLSAYYCDICGEETSKTTLLSLAIIVNGDRVRDFSEVCPSCRDDVYDASDPLPKEFALKGDTDV